MRMQVTRNERIRPSGVVHESVSRRTAIQAGSVGLLGLGMNHVSALQAADFKTSAPGGGLAKSVIFVFLSGGMTQHDSLDPKPEAPVGIRGLFAPIATRSPGVQICEHLPLLAARSQKWSLIRSLTTPYNEHSQGHTSILTGRTEMPLGYNPSKPQPSDWPSIASVVGDVLPRRNNNLPPAIVLPERLIHNTGRVLPGQFGGQMGSHRDPWFVEASPYNSKSYGAYPEYEFHFVRGRERNPNLKFQAPNLSLPQGLDVGRLGHRSELLTLLDQQRADLERTATVANFDRHRQSAISLLTDIRMQRAFDVHNADPRDLDRYGRNAFGWSLLMARQLVEQGVGLVQVNLGNNEAWDTHENNFPLLRDCLLPPTDRGLAALLDDLDERGLLNETLIVMCGEMGRMERRVGSPAPHLFRRTDPRVDLKVHDMTPRNFHQHTLGINRREALQVGSCGFARETRPFQPHLTLARIKGRPPQKLFDLLRDHQQSSFGEVPIHSLELIRSELHPDGARYSVLSSHQLSAS